MQSPYNNKNNNSWITTSLQLHVMTECSKPIRYNEKKVKATRPHPVLILVYIEKVIKIAHIFNATRDIPVKGWCTLEHFPTYPKFQKLFEEILFVNTIKCFTVVNKTTILFLLFERCLSFMLWSANIASTVPTSGLNPNCASLNKIAFRLFH